MTATRRFTTAERRALEGIDILSDSRGSADLAALRANGHRRDVLDRLCWRGYAYTTGSVVGEVRYALTREGRAALDAGGEESR
jgi:hypothetical protein